jgi:hypothetical protein
MKKQKNRNVQRNTGGNKRRTFPSIAVDRVDAPEGFSGPEPAVVTLLKSIPGAGTPECKTFLIEFFRQTYVLGGGAIGTRLNELMNPETTPPGTHSEEVMAVVAELHKLNQEQPQTIQRTSRAIIFSRHVDNYLAYLSEMIALILRSRPETLRSSKTVLLEDVLKFKSIEDFILDQVELEVNALAHKGYNEIKKYFGKFGLTLTQDGQDEKFLIRAIEDRNLFTHRRGIIDKKYIERLNEASIDTSELVIGTHLVDIPNYPPPESLTEINKSVAWLDESACQKFSLEEVGIGLAVMIQAVPTIIGLKETSDEIDITMPN